MQGDLSTIKGAVAIIPAAGIGERMKASKPKQYLKVGDRTILGITLDKFLSYDSVELVVLVISPSDQYFQDLRYIDHEKIVVIDGCDERVGSVHNALTFLFDNGLPDNTAILVHDAARPCVTHSDIDKVYHSFKQSNKPAFLAVPVVDTLHKIDDNQHVEGPVDRSDLVRALTPQVSAFIDLHNAIKSAIENKLPVTDDISALKLAGHEVEVVFGRNDNIKITEPDDLALAEFYIERQKDK